MHQRDKNTLPRSTPMNTKGFFSFLFCLVLLCPLFLSACGSNTLEKINGRWLIDVEKTVAADPSMQGDDTITSMGRDMAKALLKGMELKFDVPKKTVSGKLVGISFSNETFGVVEDSSKSATILVLRTKYTFTVDNTVLRMTNEDGTVLVFNRAPK